MTSSRKDFYPVLTLSRKQHESILIHTREGDVIRLTVMAIYGKLVRLGFETDRSIEIWREELVENGGGGLRGNTSGGQVP